MHNPKRIWARFIDKDNIEIVDPGKKSESALNKEQIYEVLYVPYDESNYELTGWEYHIDDSMDAALEKFRSIDIIAVAKVKPTYTEGE